MNTSHQVLLTWNIHHPSPLFLRALEEDSNRELEWLWYADNVTSDAERSYCWQRALYINPQNLQTQEKLFALQRQHIQAPPRQNTNWLSRLRTLVGQS